MRVLHVTEAAQWAVAAATGEYRGSTRGQDLAQVGYVHASGAEQVSAVLDGLYDDVPADDLVLLVLDTDSCAAAGSPLRWEVPEGGDVAFPHIHGPVPAAAVVAVLPLARDGRWHVPDLSGLDVVPGPG